MSIKQRRYNWRIASGDLEIEVDGRAGGKIRRMVSRKSKRNFFFKDPRKHPKGKMYLEHDISGFDECFPTVGQAQGPYGHDHGVLWDVPWKILRQGGQLISRAARPHGMPIIFTRIISKSGPGKIHLDYTILNTGHDPIPFIYSSHPILALDPHSKIILPNVNHLSVLGHNGQLKSGVRQPWPTAILRKGATTRLDTHFIHRRQLAGKWFAKGIDSAEITFPKTKERLVLRWDMEKLPFMGLWLSLGVPLDIKHPEPSDWVCAALEPCTFDHDVVSQRKTPQLNPGEPFSFWIEWELRSRVRAVQRARRKMIMKKIRSMLPLGHKRTGKKSHE